MTRLLGAALAAKIWTQGVYIAVPDSAPVLTQMNENNINRPDSFCESSGVAPFPAEDKRCERLSRPRSQLALLQLLRQRFRIAGISQREPRDGFIALRNRKQFARFLRQDSSHLMKLQPVRRRLHRQVRCGLANIVERVPIDLAIVLEIQPRDAQPDHRRVPGPTL